jgi:hypothetical protein
MSDLGEKMKIEKEVMQIAEQEDYVELEEAQKLMSMQEPNEHDQLAAWLEQTEKEKIDAKEKEDQERMIRLKDREKKERLKENLWNQEKDRRSLEDKKWEANQVAVHDDVLNSGQKETEMRSDTNVSVSKLEETIFKIQQQMAEGNDHIRYEIKIKEEQDKKEKESECKRQKEMENLRITKSTSSKHYQKNHDYYKSHRSKDSANNDKTVPLAKHSSPKKIKVRVEVESPKKESPEKIDKKVAANTIVKLLVPFFKKGQIASREVFKCCAREFTTILLESQWTEDIKKGPIPIDSYSKYVGDFFTKSGIILTEENAKLKIGQFKATVNKKELA